MNDWLVVEDDMEFPYMYMIGDDADQHDFITLLLKIELFCVASSEMIGVSPPDDAN